MNEKTTLMDRCNANKAEIAMLHGAVAILMQKHGISQMLFTNDSGKVEVEMTGVSAPTLGLRYADNGENAL